MKGQSDEPANLSSGGLGIDWTRPGTWGRLIIFTLLFSAVVAVAPAIIGMAVERLFPVGGATLENLILFLSLLLVPALVVTARRDALQAAREPPFMILQHASKIECYVLIGWMLPTSLVAWHVSEGFQRIFNLGFDSTSASVVLFVSLFMLVIDVLVSWLRRPEPASKT